MARIAFIGLGTMGLPMARHLLAAGHALTCHDVVPERAHALGTAVAATPAEAVAGADVAITSLPSVAAVEEVSLGADGIRDAAPRGSCLIDMSTSSPALARRIAAELEAGGIDCLDAPVSGGPAGAEAATLAIMVGGRKEIFDRNREVLESLGSLVAYIGDHGSGQAMKLCNNLVVAATMAAIAEACAVIARQGIDPSRAYEVLMRSTGDSRVLRMRFPISGVRPEHPASDGYRPLFRLDLLAKDLDLALDLAKESGVTAAVAERAAEAYSSARDAGFGALDYSAVYRMVAPAP